MIQIQWFQAFLLVLGLIASSVVVIASYRKANREQQDANNRSWSDAVAALKAHNDALVERLKDAEQMQADQNREIGVLQGAITSFEREKRTWANRNMHLYDRCQSLRAKLATLGVKTEEINGED